MDLEWGLNLRSLLPQDFHRQRLVRLEEEEGINNNSLFKHSQHRVHLVQPLPRHNNNIFKHNNSLFKQHSQHQVHLVPLAPPPLQLPQVLHRLNQLRRSAQHSLLSVLNNNRHQHLDRTLHQLSQHQVHLAVNSNRHLHSDRPLLKQLALDSLLSGLNNNNRHRHLDLALHQVHSEVSNSNNKRQLSETVHLDLQLILGLGPLHLVVNNNNRHHLSVLVHLVVLRASHLPLPLRPLVTIATVDKVPLAKVVDKVATKLRVNSLQVVIAGLEINVNTLTTWVGVVE